jgi:hypothetical protein
MSLKHFIFAALTTAIGCHRPSAAPELPKTTASLAGCYVWRFEPLAGLHFPETTRLLAAPIKSRGSSNPRYEGQMPRRLKQQFPGHVSWTTHLDSLSVRYEHFMYRSTVRVRVTVDSLVGLASESSDVESAMPQPTWRAIGRKIPC